MSTNLPAVVEPIVTTLAEVETVARACAQSGYYKDVKDASQAIVKMLAGREMGIGPIRAIAEIHIVEGKPTAGASLIAANVKRSGRYDYRVLEHTETSCKLEWFEHGASVGTSEFTKEDAKRAGLDGRPNWKKYPKSMYFARALTAGARVYCPDATHGVIYTAEELSPQMEVDEDGAPVDYAPPEPVIVTAEPVVPDSPLMLTDEHQKKLKHAAAHRIKELAGKGNADLADIVENDAKAWEALSEEIRTRSWESVGCETAEVTPDNQFPLLMRYVQAWEPTGKPAEDFVTNDDPRQQELAS